jgi:thiol-disulfide isomerase/thioredoxin
MFQIPMENMTTRTMNHKSQAIKSLAIKSLAMRKFALFAAIVAATVAATATGCVSEEPVDHSDAHLPLGTPMPQFAVSGPTGALSGANLSGEKTLIVLFRSTCPDCRRELPKVDAAYKAIGGEEAEVRIVPVSQEDTATVEAYWNEAGYSMPWYVAADPEVFPAFGVQYVPTLYLFDSEGRIAFASVETFDFDAAGLIELIGSLD